MSHSRHRTRTLVSVMSCTFRALSHSGRSDPGRRADSWLKTRESADTLPSATAPLRGQVEGRV